MTDATLPAWLRDELRAIADAIGASEADAALQNSAAVKTSAAAQPAETAAAAGEQSPTAGPQTASDGVLSRLAAKLARLDALEQHFQQTLEREKLTALKELAYGAGHEINNPLANISARAQTLLRDEGDPDRRRLLAAINTQAFRAYEMIADMMLFARPPEPKFQQVDVAVLVAGVGEEMQPPAARQHTQLAIDVPNGVLASVDPTQLAVAVRALCSNSLEALVTGGRVELSLKSSPQDVEISVADNGPGIPAEIRPRVFDPFFSGREAGRGLGFGLPKSWRIAEMHGGKIHVTVTASGQTVFILSIPRNR